ncbi:Two component regulator propeller [Peptoclostridium litorale DSM 5388]|uniref:SbsA Ig-like domain-containing protein n=1 Tax=Peptoclostridium litorale DSM 5388 TaxID=1121324 RepID=A0A069RD46_PEPLI|nr:two-component regulator propeller domain-containing protein [Peptoclostridium litorale]KDR94961.1 hypothetical protein CLIT_12c00290 [Peptoclostridium litorale DSM 5388]SIO33766.1 Two component regulator propeller [Peptoclostridium litorale DSM 5388]
MIRKLFLTLFAAAVLYLFSFSSFAEEWSSIETDGIPYLNPEGIYFDNDGGRWITGQSKEKGSVFFWSEDGSHEYYDSAYTRGNIKNDAQVKDMLFDEKGSMWFATWGDGLKIKKSDGTWLSFNQNDDYDKYIMSDEVIQILDAGAEGKWILTYAGAYLVSNDYEVVSGKSHILSDLHPASIFRDSSGYLWIGTEYGILTDSNSENGYLDYVSNIYSGSNVPPADYSHAFSSIAQDADGNIWFGSSNYGIDGIYKLSAGGQWSKYTDSDPSVPSVSVTDMEYDSENDVIWVSTYHGDLIKVSSGSIQSYSGESLGISGDSIHSLRLDSDNGLWLICDDFMSSIYEITDFTAGLSSKYNINSTSNSLVSYRIHDMKIDKSGGLWVAGDDGVSRRTPDGEWIQYKNLGPFQAGGITADSNNIVYIIMWKGEVKAYDVQNEKWIDIVQPPVEIFAAYGAYTDSKDGKWFYTGDGVYYLSPDNGSWEIYSYESTGGAIPDNIISCAYEDSIGNIWIGTRNGAAVMSIDGSWKGFSSGDSGFMGGEVNSFVESDSGILYASGSYGVQKYSQSGWTNVGYSDFPGGLALKMENGDIWSGTTLLKKNGEKIKYDSDSTGGVIPESSYLGGILKSSDYDQYGDVYFAYMYDGIKVVSGIQWDSSQIGDTPVDESKYSLWNSQSTPAVSTGYIWSIALSGEADKSTVNSSNIFVCKNGSSVKHDVSVALNTSDPSTIEIRPVSPYQPSSDYVIYIGDSIKSSNGKSLLEAIRFEFKTN